MSMKMRKIVAIVALVSMLVFIASLMAYLIDSTWLNSAIGLIVIFSFCIAIGLYILVVVDNKFSAQKKEIEDILKKQEETAKQTEKVESKDMIDIVKE